MIFYIILHLISNTNYMKKVFIFISVLLFINICLYPNHNNRHSYAFTPQSPKLAIVIDDFGSYEQAGVETLLKADCSLTCAVLPFVDNTEKNIEELKNTNHEIILHMPMQSHVNLPENWYGPIYISKYDSSDIIISKLETCLSQFDNIKGFNIHIGSGVSQNKNLMKIIYEFAKTHNLYFFDSRTIKTNATQNACDETSSIYLGRDVFLEADKNKTYSGVKFRINEAINIAKEKGIAIAIGHVGAEGGENTARAIIDSLPLIKAEGVQIVPLSSIFEYMKNNNLKSNM